MLKWQKTIIITLSLLLGFHASSSFAAYKVAEAEIKSSKPVQFVDFTGRSRQVLDTVRGVVGIGDFLASNPDTQTLVYQGKYRVTKLRDPQDVKLFSADIIEILSSARVNTIKDLRRILQGYLQTAYTYNENDAQLLAMFLTYYNGFYRANVDSMKEKYSPLVIKALNPNFVGLAPRYSQWAGQSQLIVPLVNDGLGGGIDAFEVGNQDVQKALSQEPDKGINEREAIVNAQQVQLGQEKEALGANKGALDQEKQDLQAQNKILANDLQNAKTPEEKAKIQQEIDKNNQSLENNQKASDNLKEDQQKINNQEQQLQSSQEALNQDKQVVNQQQPAQNQAQTQQEQTTPAPQQQPQQTQAPAQQAQPAPQEQPTQNQTPAQQPAPQQQPTQANNPTQTPPPQAQLQETVQNQQKQLDRNEKVENDTFYYLRKISYYSGEHKDSALVMVDALSQKVKKSSSLKTISGNRFDIFDQGIVVIARENPKSETNHLTLLDKQSLEITKVGKENIYISGMVRVEGQNIYAIYQKENSDDYYLGKFDLNLTLTSSSPTPVDKDTFLSFYKGKIYLSTNDSSGISILNDSDLSLNDSQVTE